MQGLVNACRLQSSVDQIRNYPVDKTPGRFSKACALDVEFLLSSCWDRLAARVRGGGGREFEPTGWERVDRTVQKGRERLMAAREEEDFQGVGLLCREALITLGQVVWVAERHPPVDGVIPSDTDAKRRLEAYIAVELGTNANELANTQRPH